MSSKYENWRDIIVIGGVHMFNTRSMTLIWY